MNPTEEKLEKIAELLRKLTDPMACVLKEIKASNRSRWIVLLGMASIVVVMASIQFVVMDRMNRMADQIEQSQGVLIMQMAQGQDLIDYVARSAKTPEQRAAVAEIRNLYGKSPATLIKAAAQFAPEAILEAARDLEVKDGSSLQKK
jgi:hypothetical protein